MPTSQWSQLGVIVDAMVRLDPASVLDVGVGHGKWGFLAREYLELWDGEENYGQRTRRIEGIEGHEPYLDLLSHHAAFYDRIHRGEAVATLRTLPDASFDLALAIDVLEHLDREGGLRLIAEATRVASVLIVSVPRRFVAREEAFGNPYDAHVTPWTRSDLRGAGAKAILCNPASHVGVFCRGELPAPLRPAARARRLARLLLKGKLY